jgi:trehalose/maltose hydrolase-like predicted phosphorylase
VILGFGGVELSGERLRIEPRLPPEWRSLSFRVCWRGRRVSVRVAARMVEVELASGEMMEVTIAGATQQHEPGAKLEVSL